VIKNAQKSHGEIKDKINNVYGKSWAPYSVFLHYIS
jgi:hypothetical protein